jgi:hypothetical protein
LTPNKEKVKVLCQFIGSELQSYKEFYEWIQKKSYYLSPSLVK